MVLFIGGPYDGEDLPVDRKLTEVRLPALNQFDQYRADKTASKNWPYIYLRDDTEDPPVYRFHGKQV